QAQVIALTQAGEDLTLPEPVDLAYCRFVLLHVRDPVVVLKRMGGAVRPGGWVVAQEPITTAGRIDGRPFSQPAALHPDVAPPLPPGGGAVRPRVAGVPGRARVAGGAEAPAGIGPGPVAEYLEAVTDVDPGDDPVVLPPLVTVVARRSVA